MKRYRVAEEQDFARTPTPPSATRCRSGTPKSVVRISLSAQPDELLIKPGSINIFNSSIIPAIDSFQVPEDSETGPRIAFKLPSGKRFCKRFRKDERIGSLRAWVRQEVFGESSENLTCQTFTLKIVSGDCSYVVLGDSYKSLLDYGIVSDTLVLLDTDD